MNDKKYVRGLSLDVKSSLKQMIFDLPFEL